MTLDDHVAAIRAARAPIAAALAQAAALDQSADDRFARAANLEAEQTADESADIEDAAVSLLDGPNARPVNRRRAAALARRPTEIRTERRAAELERQRAADLLGSVPALALGVAAPALALLDDIQTAALQDLKRALTALLEPASRLIGVDQLADRLLGLGGYQIPTGAKPPIRGEILLKSLLAHIPAPIRPENLELAKLSESASAMSEAIIADIEGEDHD